MPSDQNLDIIMEQNHITPYTTSRKSTQQPQPQHFNNHHHDHHSHNNTSTSRSSDSGEQQQQQQQQEQQQACGSDDGKWSLKLLRECARAITERDSTKIHHLLWMLNELASPYGDLDQKLASYFLQALFCKATESGHRCYKTLTSVAEKNHSFDSARKLILKFQEVSPWTTFGHVASNGAILEALEGESKLHIVDISNTLCTQWPTLLESLATRNDETPHLKLSVVSLSNNSNDDSMVGGSVIKEVGQRMEKFARLMGVPFEFNVIGGLDHLCEVTKEVLGVQDDEAVAVNCVGALRRVEVDQRDTIIEIFKSLSPKVVTVVEEEADFASTRSDFLQCFDECLKFYSTYFEMLEESFPATSNERLMLERECSRSIVRVLACDSNSSNNHDEEFEEDCCERRERGTQWCERLNKCFSGVVLSDDVVDDVKALLKRYRPGWSLLLPSQLFQSNTNHHLHLSGIYLTWKDHPVVWASAWKP